MKGKIGFLGEVLLEKLHILLELVALWKRQELISIALVLRKWKNFMVNKIIKFLFSKEIEIAPGVFWLGGVLYENRNKPKGPPPLKFKKRDT